MDKVESETHSSQPPMLAKAESWRTRWPRFLLAGLLILAISGFYALGWQQYFSWDYVRTNLDRWQAQAQQSGAILGLFFLVYVAVTGASLPVATILSLVAGALFGRWLGTSLVSLAATLGATLAFLSSRWLLRDWVQRRFAKALAPLNRGIERDGAYYLFTLRLVPLVPFFLINLGMGLTPMRVSTFALVSWVGMLPGTFLYVNAGTALATMAEPADILSPTVLVSLALLGIVPLALHKLLISPR